jgi:hypothetical protein
MLPKRSLADLVIAVGHDKPSKGRKSMAEESESDREHEGEGGYEPDEDATIAGEDFAAAVLHELAHHGEYGGYNADINPEDVGRALSRLMPNCPGLTEQEIKDRLIQGFLENSDSG